MCITTIADAQKSRELLAFLIFVSRCPEANNHDEGRLVSGNVTNVFIFYEFPVGSINVEKPIIGVTMARTTPDKVH